MRRLPTRFTRTGPPFPYTSLFRSIPADAEAAGLPGGAGTRPAAGAVHPEPRPVPRRRPALAAAPGAVACDADPGSRRALARLSAPARRAVRPGPGMRRRRL